MLGDAAGLARDHVGVADAVEQLGLAVVDVAHDGDDRCPRSTGRLRRPLVVDQFVDAEHLLRSSTSCSSPGSTRRISALDLRSEQLDHLIGEGLGGRDHLALLHEEADDVGSRAVQQRTEVLRGGGPFDDDLALGNRRVLGRVGRHVHGLQLFAAATTTALATWRTPTSGSTRTTAGATATAGRPPPPGAATGTGYLRPWSAHRRTVAGRCGWPLLAWATADAGSRRGRRRPSRHASAHDPEAGGSAYR